MTEDNKDVRDVYLEKVENRKSKNTPINSDILVGGETNILTSLAKCCRPVFGDDIKGFITKGEGVSVHRSDCVNIKGRESRFVDVAWNSKDSVYYTGVAVETDKNKNYLLDIISKATAKNIYVDSFKTKNGNDKTTYEIIVKVKDKNTLDDFIASLYSYAFVIEARRI